MSGRFALGAIVVGLALSAVGAIVRRAHQVPPASLDAAAAHVRSTWAHGDVVVVVPGHQVGPRERLGDLPLVEAHAGYGGPGEPLVLEELEGHRRVHLMELDALGRSDRPAELLGGAALEQRSWPGVRVSTFALPTPPPVRFDLHRDIDRVQVIARYRNGDARPCDRFVNGRWLCPRNADWSYVGRAMVVVQGRPRACVWLHPLAAGEVLEVHLPAQVGTAPGELVVGSGFTTHGARAARAPVRVAVRAGERTLHVLEHPVDDRWQVETVPLHGATEPLRLEITSRDNGAAHFCAQVRVRDTP